MVITAASTSQSDVQAAVNGAAPGDTVNIPAGSSTWATGVTITKAIFLIGAGSGSTFLTRAGGFAGSFFTLSSPTDSPMRVSGISFDSVINTSANLNAILVIGSNNVGSGQSLTQVRIDQCRFNKGGRMINVVGYVYGVIDHCQFTNCNIAIGFAGDDNYAWLRPIVAGTASAMFIESCTFTVTNAGGASLNEQIYHQEGARSVTRYCTFDGTAYTLDYYTMYDAHGNQNYYTGVNNNDMRGLPIIEIYNNILHVNKAYQYLGLRGGSALVHDNVFISDTTSPPVFLLTEEEGWYSALFSPLATTWNAQDQINNSFYWNNTSNGAPVTGVTLKNPATDATFIQQNRDYWMAAPAAAGGKTTWTGVPGVTETFSGSGPNAYYPYTPYAYPHPLIAAMGGITGGGGGGGGIPSAGGGWGSGVNNPPFMPVKFQPGPPAAMVWEDGPGLYVNPTNTGAPVRYSGQTQSAAIISAQPKPPRNVLPGAAVGMSQIPNGTPQPPPITITTYTLGDTTIEAANTVAGNNTAWCQQIANVTVASRIKSISLYVFSTSAATNLRLGIYNGTSSLPTTKVAEMDTPLVVTASAWNTIQLAVPVAVAPGIYYLVWLSDVGLGVTYKAGGNIYNVGQAYGPLPSTMPATGSLNAFIFSIYATFLTP